MSEVEAAQAALDDAEQELRDAAADADSKRDAVIEAAAEWFRGWAPGRARREVEQNPQRAQSLGRDAIQAMRKEVEDLVKRAPEIAESRLRDHAGSFPHTAGNVSGADYVGRYTDTTAPKTLATELGKVLFKHEMVDPTHYSFRGWKMTASGTPYWSGDEDSLKLTPNLRSALHEYQRSAKTWAKAWEAVERAKEELERAKARELWGD